MPYQHLDQSRLRAIEFGLPLLRSANTGISAVIDSRGTVTAQLGLGQAGWLDAALPAPLHETLYAKQGDWMVLALALSLLMGLHLWCRTAEV